MTLLSAEEARVVGALAEKQLATPQYYPLTLNALVNACNQSNNRDPIVTYDEGIVEAALGSLREKGFARVVHPGSGSRVTKYRQVLDEALGLDDRELALLCVMLLRGPQTLNELRSRTERLASFDGVDAIEHDLDRLSTREDPLVVRIERQPGQREERYATTLAAVATPGRADAGRPSGGAPTSAGGRGAHRPQLLPSPRLAPLRADDADVTDDQRDLLRATGVDANNLFGTLARHPGLFRRWLPFGGKLLQGGKLSGRLRELAILRTAHLVGAAYEWGHHVEIGRAAGLTDDEIARVAQGPSAGWDGVDALVLQACDDIHERGLISDETWNGLSTELDEVRLVELPMLIGHYRMLSVVIASLGVQPEPGIPPLPPA
ncbi:MAG TPA: DUF480 domain-containing protein [Acidimicrobiales bacterium]|jgi:uncharacterized protein YceH (UPF0502 family)/alkylhydroperoxidase family enzyme|nr:DUF480 domain-containing protein [Acidimicrobiales bacterium]